MRGWAAAAPQLLTPSVILSKAKDLITLERCLPNSFRPDKVLRFAQDDGFFTTRQLKNQEELSPLNF
ncbi:hypothetical protein D3Y59_09020 [Hymenobacter oligotrophus]|uniref:Uncharacterized protein n=1 Tax=Hymenobacter oligotrophus TaxID=2319843 RepID=A0A3B7R7Z8_9BACT|nr:hypothetical protein D3Y59_09020 [Hymenobacter oligotrophus]